MKELTVSELWVVVLAAASAIVLLSNAAEKIAKVIQAAKAPNTRQDERLHDLEEWKKEVDAKLNRDKDHFDSLEAGNRAYCQALLALLDHGIDGNNIEQMQHAKESLQQHLINR